LVANSLGRSWGFVSNFLFVPVYVRLLGIENFGVIALFLAVSGVIAFFDLGLSPTLARELHDQRRNAQERISLLFTYERAYAVIVAFIILCAGLAPRGAFSVLVSGPDLLRPEVASSVRLVFVAAAMQMSFNFYVAGLMGIAEQIRGNLVVVTAGIVRSAVVLLPLWLFPQPVVYLLWQIIFALVFAALSRHFLYRAIVRGEEVRHRAFSLRMITENLDFTRGMFLVAVISAIITQTDKLFISRLAGMGALGRYSLASTFAQLIVFVVSPITLTVMPRFVHSVSAGDSDAVRTAFLTAHRLVAAIVCSTVGCMLFFGPYLIGVWTGGKLGSESIGGYLAPLVVGYASVALQTVPHCVAVANKNLRGILLLGGAGVLFALPAYWYSINRFGAVGAATTWLLLQLALYPLYLGWVNRRLLQLNSLAKNLMLRTVLLPGAGTLAISFIASRFLSANNGVVGNLTLTATALLACALFCFLTILRRADAEYLFGSVS
jgi:O-antigen/teichoic acid export membrane protein